MAGIVVDASAVIDAFSGDPATQRALLDADALLVSAVVVADLWFGALISTRAAVERARVDGFLDRCQIVNVDVEIARCAAEIRRRLQLGGKRIPQDDLFVAATALVLDLPLLARDAHFEHIEGLRLISP